MSHLHPYQQTGASWLAAKKHAVLADQMGLGKTIQAIAAVDELALKRMLIVCPAVARVNWQREFAKFAIYDRKFVIVDSQPEQGLQRLPGFSLIMSYERAVMLHDAGYFEKEKFDLLILDEGHYLKNPFAKRTAKILGKEGLHRCANRIWALTGTPVTKDIGDIWPYLFTFGATKMNYTMFVGFYCITERHPTHAYMRRVIGLKPTALRNLKETIAKVCLRRTIDQVLPDLPKVSYGEITVERGEVDLTTEERAQIDEELKMLDLAGGDLSSKDALSVLELMARSCSTLRRYLGMQKIAPAIALLKEELESYDHKIVVFAHHKRVCNAVVSALGDAAVVLTGDTGLQERQAAIDRFQTDPKCRVFVASILAAATAITLTAAHHIVFIEQDWIPANNEQAVGRCHRIGQKMPILVRNLTVANSIDEAVSRVLRRRSKQISEVIS